MKLLNESNTIHNNKDMDLKIIDRSAHNLKEKTSDVLMAMNPVASGDNVANVLNSAHKLKEDTPSLVPCCEGKVLLINEDLVRSGLSVISMKHESVMQCLSLSRASERLVAPGLVKHRNSFRSLHRPDLKRVPYLRRMSPDELETLFKGYSEMPSRAVSKESQDGQKFSPEEQVVLRNLKDKNALMDDGNGLSLHPIPETRSGAEDVPVGMRLHGARARLYTSVLAGAKTGDQLDGISIDEVLDPQVHDDPLPEDEVVMKEELQIILPPRCDDVMDSTSPNSCDASSTSSYRDFL